jgi:tRNA nucleotidyltransferase/poly(A) polymerase
MFAIGRRFLLPPLVSLRPFSWTMMSSSSLATSPNFIALLTSNPELARLRGVFDKHGFPLRFAGGPVRDLLLGKMPADLDFATTATPEEMKAMFETEGVRTINALGERHGTITARNGVARCIEHLNFL